VSPSWSSLSCSMSYQTPLGTAQWPQKVKAPRRMAWYAFEPFWKHLSYSSDSAMHETYFSAPSLHSGHACPRSVQSATRPCVLQTCCTQNTAEGGKTSASPNLNLLIYKMIMT
jgi:hypothetical protein